MERDEHEMLIEYSEMTTFNFNSKEYQEVKRDYLECKNALDNLRGLLRRVLFSLRLVRTGV